MHRKRKFGGTRGIPKLLEEPKKLAATLSKHAFVFAHVNYRIEHDKHLVGSFEVMPIVPSFCKSSFVLFICKVFRQIFLWKPSIKQFIKVKNLLCAFTRHLVVHYDIIVAYDGENIYAWKFLPNYSHVFSYQSFLFGP